MIIKYIFNNNEYNSLNDLALAYSKNFIKATEDIKSNYKKLFHFVKKVNKRLYKESLDIFYKTKYINNVTTFLIFIFSQETIICINGKNHNFEDFIKGYKNSPKDYIPFIKDYGLERIFSKSTSDRLFIENIDVIRNNIEDKFVSDYLAKYFDYDGLEAIMPYFEPILDDKKEAFYKMNNLFKSSNLCNVLAHKYGLNTVIKIKNNEYPIFKGLNLIKELFIDEELIEILTNNHLIWLLDNYENYSYKSKAKSLKNKLKLINKKYRRIYDASDLESIIDIMIKLADCYNLFIKYSKERLIEPVVEGYNINIKYYNTYISIDFMNQYDLSLSLDNNQETVLNHVKEKHIDVKKEERRLNKLVKYNSGLQFFTGIALIYLILVIITSFLKLNIFDLPLADYSLDYLCIAFLISIYGLSIITSYGIENSKKAINNIKRYNMHEDNKKNYKLSSSSKRIITALTSAMLAFVYGVILINVINSFLLDFVNRYMDWTKVYETNSSALHLLIIGPGLSFLYGLIRRKKGFLTNIIIIIFAVLGVILPVIL